MASEDDNSTPASRVVDYADYSTDVVPDYIASVESLIDDGESPAAARATFASGAETIHYFARSIRRRFGEWNPAGACCCCTQAPADGVVEIQWTLHWDHEALKRGATLMSNTERFRTQHSMCSACFDRWDRGSRGRLIRPGVGILLIVLAFVLGFVAIRLFEINVVRGGQEWIAVVGICVPLALSAMVFHLSRRRLVRSVPAAIKKLLPFPLELEQTVWHAGLESSESLDTRQLKQMALSSPDWIDIRNETIVEGNGCKFVQDPAAGGIAVFLGCTRAEKSPDGRELLALDYEAYQEMALKQMQELARQAREKWPIIKLALLHRVGRVGLGEPSVLIAVSTPHRGEAFEACRWLIDTLKKDVAIWKKEVWADGSGTWVHR